jgi:hypothetical protein
MDKPHTADELAGLRQFLERLESGYVRLRRNQVDVTKSEVAFLKREIANLERILSRSKSGGKNAGTPSAVRPGTVAYDGMLCTSN